MTGLNAIIVSPVPIILDIALTPRLVMPAVAEKKAAALQNAKCLW